MIITIFGKKGSGKSTLSKELMYRIGNRAIFISPVENLKDFDFELWSYEDIDLYIPVMEPGQISILRLADQDAFDMISCLVMIETGYTLVIDEIERYKNTSNLSDLIHYARHFDIHIIANTRRYTDVPRLLTSQSDQIIIFQTEEPRDLQYLQDYTGISHLTHVKSLTPFNYYVFPGGEIKQTDRAFC